MNVNEAVILVEEACREAVASDVDLLVRAGEHIVAAGGKRLRPKVALLSYAAAGGQDLTQAVKVAAAIELLHTASLIHDDINDRSGMRRGRATVNALWGNSLALLVGDFVFVRFLKLMAGLEPAIINVLADCCTLIVEGETLQMVHAGDVEMDETTYLDMVRRKTASLFAASGELGALLAQGGKDRVRALRAYGLNLGMAFQIRDDTLDLSGVAQEMGKPAGSDLAQGKLSLATIHARRQQPDADAILAGGGLQAVQLLRHTGALQYAMSRAREYAYEAKGALSALPESDACLALEELADFAVSRGH